MSGSFTFLFCGIISPLFFSNLALFRKKYVNLNVSMPPELWLSSIYKKQSWSADLMVCLLKKSMAFYRKRSERDILANESKSDMWSLLPDYYSICSVLTWKSITVSLSHWQRMLIGLARDLRGIAFALNTKTSYTMLFDWMYPYYTVTIPALCTEGSRPLAFV